MLEGYSKVSFELLGPSTFELKRKSVWYVEKTTKLGFKIMLQ